ncbi:Sensor protein ZraS [bacterium HR19]|nr:Sensor protein ZraS [bacterium HR19]
MVKSKEKEEEKNKSSNQAIYITISEDNIEISEKKPDLENEKRYIVLDFQSGERKVFLITDEQLIIKKIREKMPEIFLEEKYEGMKEMLLFLTHEIKNPLFALTTRIISLDIDKEKMKPIKSLLDRVNSIFDNITIFIKGKTANLKKENVESIIEESIKEIEEIKDETFSYDFEIKREYRSDKIFIKGDRFLLKRAFLNIIMNSAESLEKSKNKVIEVKTYDEGNFIKCEFSDTGCGIPENIKQKIFIPFFTTKTKGMGLGMSTVKKIIELHNGKIDVESEEGKGTKVTILLPSYE